MKPEELATCQNLLELLQDENGEVAQYWQMMLEHIDSQAQQIEALKAGWIEERAARIFYETYPGVSDYYTWKGYPEDAFQMRPKRFIRDEAHRTLAAEHPDLFGQGAEERHVWKVTEERKIALKHVEMHLTGRQPKDLHWDRMAITIIRAMLQEARP